jgi:hypothetical protein
MGVLVTNEEIAKRLEQHDSKLVHLSNTVDRIENQLNPITAVYVDIAAVGRVGRCAGNVIKWVAGVGLAVTAIWAAVRHGLHK